MDIISSKAIISGGASGLGLKTAEKIINSGGMAVLMDLNSEQGNANAKKLGNRALFVKTDVTSENEVQTAIGEANNFMEGITLAVSCAGIVGAARALGREKPMPVEFFSQTIKVNLIGSFLISKDSERVSGQIIGIDGNALRLD